MGPASNSEKKVKWNSVCEAKGKGKDRGLGKVGKGQPGENQGNVLANRGAVADKNGNRK